MARVFNGTTDWIDCGNDTATNPATTMTLGAWVNIPNSSATYTVFSRTNSGVAGQGFAFKVAQGAANGLLHLVKLGAIDITGTGLIYTAATWAFVGVTVTPANCRFFRVTSAGVFTAVDIADAAGFAAGANTFRIGTLANGVANAQFFSGSIAYACMNVGVALSDANITTAAFTPTTAWWPSLLMPLMSTPETDLTGFAPSITLNGTTSDTANPVFVSNPDPAASHYRVIKRRRP